MSARDFLSAVLPTDGWYCVTGLKDGAPRQKFMQTLDEVEGEVERLLSDEYDVYFACAKFKESGKRDIENATYFKSFRLDIDCGHGKPYESQAEGIEALSDFCAKLKLPTPTIVNSGRGVHVYWTLHETLPRSAWKPIAEQLKSLCAKHKLNVDHAITADAARILRVPNTLNFKTDPPLPVSVLHMASNIHIDAFAAILKDAGGVVTHSGFNRPTTDVDPNTQYRFSTILQKNEQGTGCAQLEHIIRNRDTISYNQWFYALSIAKFCVDADQAIHTVSEGHADYTPENTEKKADQVQHWTSCRKFEEENPGGCRGCAHKKIGTPLKLGAEIKVSNKREMLVKETVGELVHTVSHEIPELPYPFVVGETGGIYKWTRDEEDEGPTQVYPHNLFVLKRMSDPDKGMCAYMRLETPLDGIVEFTIPMSDMAQSNKLKERLAFRGIVGTAAQMELIMFYIVSCCNKLITEKEAEKMKLQFGWIEEDSRFVVGNREIGADTIKHSPPASSMEYVASMMEPKGTLQEWRSVIDTYNRPGLEPHAFAFSSCFGSPILKFMGVRGAVINLISDDSGTGKTTILKAINSLVGHPTDLMCTFNDTTNFKLNRMAMMNNLAFTCDEITNVSPEDFSNFAYAASNGKNRGRLRSSENTERINLTWENITVSTSNASFYDKLHLLKESPDGEMMRTMEYEIHPTNLFSKEEADALFGKLNDNYGTAADIYFTYLAGHVEDVSELAKHIQKEIDKAAGLQSRERYWSAVASANIAGLVVANHLNLTSIDAKRIMKWVIEYLKNLKLQIAPPLSNQSSVIGEFLNAHRNNVLVVNNNTDKRTGMEQLPIREPRLELMVRIEPDTKRLYITAKSLQNFCGKQQTNMKELLLKLKEDGVFMDKVKKRMAKGTMIASPPVWAYEFNCDNGEFVDTDAYVNRIVSVDKLRSEPYETAPDNV
jgi:energy-coupling factor transporter ATP-binding protein EcfA2